MSKEWLQISLLGEKLISVRKDLEDFLLNGNDLEVYGNGGLLFSHQIYEPVARVCRRQQNLAVWANLGLPQPKNNRETIVQRIPGSALVVVKDRLNVTVPTVESFEKNLERYLKNISSELDSITEILSLIRG